MSMKPGQRWLFTHSSGRETEYVLLDPGDDKQMTKQEQRRLMARWEGDQCHPCSIFYLRNQKTGEVAGVTYFWLMMGSPGWGGAYWSPVARAA